jgi:hypothetical protein
MAPAEMIQTEPQKALAQQNTPPSSPNQSEHIAAWDDAHQFIDALKAIVAMQIASAPAPAPAPKCACSHTSDESQTLQAAQPLTVEHLEQLLLKLINAKSEPPKVSEDAKPDAHPEATRAFKLEYKIVTEVYASNGALIKHS